MATAHMLTMFLVFEVPKGACGQDHASHPGGQSAVGCGQKGAATAGSSRRFACLQDDRHPILTELQSPLGPCPRGHRLGPGPPPSARLLGDGGNVIADNEGS